MIEAGGRWEWMGNTITVAMILKYFGLVRSKEKRTVTFANNYGGLSNIAAGCAAPPPRSVFDPVGIDLTNETEDARKDMWIQEQPDELVGKRTCASWRPPTALGITGERWKNSSTRSGAVEAGTACLVQDRREMDRSCIRRRGGK